MIDTSSPEAGLDFACNLIATALSDLGESDSSRAQVLLRGLASYLRLRYVGEVSLALEYLASLGHECNPAFFCSEQFWAQVRWVAEQLEVSPQELAALNLPDA
jgi:hypothetical protein